MADVDCFSRDARDRRQRSCAARRNGERRSRSVHGSGHPRAGSGRRRRAPRARPGRGGQASRDIEPQQAQHSERNLAGQIEIAIAKGDEDLARAGIARQVDIEDQIPVLQRSLQDAMEQGKELEGYVMALLAKKREMEWRLRDFVASRARARREPPRRFARATLGARGQGRACRLGLRSCAERDRPGSQASRRRSIRTHPSCMSCRSWPGAIGSTNVLRH